MNALDFLETPQGAAEAAPSTPVVETPAGAPAAETPLAPESEDQSTPEGRVRGPDGKFAAKAAPQSEAQAEGDRVPLGEHIRERKLRQAAEAEAAELRTQVDRLKPAATPEAKPDRYADPDAYDAWEAEQQNARFQRVEIARVNDKLNFSERLARKEHGPELVEEAKAWFKQQTDPALNRRVFSAPDPYEDVVTLFQDSKTTAAMNDPATLEAFKAWQATQVAGATDTSPAAQAAPQSRPTRSIVHAPAAGGGKPGEQPVGAGVAYDSVIK